MATRRFVGIMELEAFEGWGWNVQLDIDNSKGMFLTLKDFKVPKRLYYSLLLIYLL